MQSLLSVSVIDKQPRTIVACCLHPTNSSFSQALVNTFVETNRQCNANFKQSGSTATVVIVTGLKDRGGVGGSDRQRDSQRPPFPSRDGGDNFDRHHDSQRLPFPSTRGGASARSEQDFSRPSSHLGQQCPLDQPYLPNPSPTPSYRPSSVNTAPAEDQGSQRGGSFSGAASRQRPASQQAPYSSGSRADDSGRNGFSRCVVC